MSLFSHFGRTSLIYKTKMTENTGQVGKTGKTQKTKKTNKTEKDTIIQRPNSNTNGISMKDAYSCVGGSGDARLAVADLGFGHPKEN